MLVDFTHARLCKPFCENSLTLPDMCRKVFKRYKYPHIKIAPNLYDQVLSNLPRSKSIINLYKKQKLECLAFEFFWRRHPDLNWGMRLLQSLALPLGYDATWSERRGSNSLPPPWQGGALPDELRSQNMVPPGGIEPPTRGFSVPCSTN